MFRTDSAGAIRHLWRAGWFIVLLGVALWLFWPGLEGPFLFDDWANLNALGADGGIYNRYTFLNFVFGGRAGPLGRPLAMLSFLINDHAWPTDARSFKYTNLMLHLLAACLLFWLLVRIGQARDSTVRWPLIVSITVTALWLIHPIHLPTIMLVVQRMTQLESIFTLTGLLCFVIGRDQVLAGRFSGWWWLTLGVGTSGVLAVLSKESGVLLAAYIGVLLTTLTPVPPTTPWRGWTTVAVIFPLAATAAFLCLPFDRLQEGYAMRTFTMGERLLTEPRILFDYLRTILIPDVAAQSIFFDDYTVSRGLLEPLTTLPAVVGVVGLVGVGLALRKTVPLAAFAILWWFGGHALESSVVPLELYFPHRNYLPMLGPLLGLTVGAAHLPVGARRLAAVGLCLYGIAFATFTRVDSHYWASGERLGSVWAREHPKSNRAHQLLAGVYLDRGNIDEAEAELERALHTEPKDLAIVTQWVYLRCLNNQLSPADWQWALNQMTTAAFSTPVFETLKRTRAAIADKSCTQLTVADLLAASEALQRNATVSARKNARQGLWRDRSRTYEALRDLDGAVTCLENAYRITPNYWDAAQAAAFLANAGLGEEARRFVDLANTAPPPTPWLRLLGVRPHITLQEPGAPNPNRPQGPR